jgi:putative nucleotidyltransferase with HDIG domain
MTRHHTPNHAQADAPAPGSHVTFEMVRDHPRVRLHVRRADESLEKIGYTEHGERHVGLVANIAGNILKRLGYPEREVELARIAGYLHDIGNAVNRDHHAQSGAVMAMQILDGMGMPADEMLTVVAAIGNHHEADGDPVSAVSAAIILADKSDVHRSRVRNPDMIKFDIHDRVNYAVQKSFLNVDEAGKQITLELTVDTGISQVMEYFEIFMTRLLASRKAASFLGATFGLTVNGTRLM